LREFFIGIRIPAPIAPAASRSEDPPMPQRAPARRPPTGCRRTCAGRRSNAPAVVRRSGCSSLEGGAWTHPGVGLSGKRTRVSSRPSSCSRAPVGYIRRLRPPFETFPRASFGLGLGRVVPC
jgi:hypothetical protein